MAGNCSHQRLKTPANDTCSTGNAVVNGQQREEQSKANAIARRNTNTTRSSRAKADDAWPRTAAVKVRLLNCIYPCYPHVLFCC